MSSVTINDVARQAGVSKKTVSRVINNEINVSVETRDKVMAVINQLGFKRNPLGMALAKNRSLFIALLADNPSPGYLQKLQKGILRNVLIFLPQLVSVFASIAFIESNIVFFFVIIRNKRIQWVQHF